MTFRQFISNLLISSKSITSDGFIPPKFIYNETLLAISNLIKQDKDARRAFWRNTDFFGWQRLPKIELEEVPVSEGVACGYTGEYTILKSVKKIPSINMYVYGSIIKYVSSINFGIFFDPTTPRQFNSIQKRKYKDKTKRYYFISDNYLYILLEKNEHFPLKVVTMEAFFKNVQEVVLFNKGCDDDVDLCKSPLDYEVPAPDYLLSNIEQMVLQTIRNYYLSTPTDEYHNLNKNDITNQRDIQNITQ